MAYDKGKGMDDINSVRGMCSYKKNPMPKPREVPKDIGMSSNPDKAKVNRLMQKAYREEDSLRGKMGM